MRYAQGGGLTAGERERRERLRLQGAELFAQGVAPQGSRCSEQLEPGPWLSTARPWSYREIGRSARWASSVKKAR